MRFIVDEYTGPAVAEWLRKQNHEVFSVYEEARGMDDDFEQAWNYSGLLNRMESVSSCFCGLPHNIQIVKLCS